MKRILITGAASGLGLALAKKYASEDWSVCIADIQDEEGIKIASDLSEEYGNDCFFQHLDITRDAQWQELVGIICERWQGLDALVNNAGVAASGDIDTFSMKDFQWTVDINLMGAVKGCHVCVPLLKESKGFLINVASMAGLLHMGGMSAYNVSKASMVAFSEGLLSELDPYGVNVSVVCPTFFQSNLAKSMRSDNPDAARIAARLHAGTGITAEGIAATVYDESRKGKHYILAGTRFSDRTIWRLKRYLPAAYLGMMKSNARIQFADRNPSSAKEGFSTRVLRSIRSRVLG
ncbi:SDR family oxidoreductase [Halieaceae bacterium IMCC8485]|uniref:SDR family oxidoreductase n=1 Tax=Candidatus Seongchinamella marina TaxID=2518990 RepID=A0ABT3SZH5_9GAMM|nr:SDR family oxidoreductase [Candidatus Seongchinamella marina]MCX2975001.1 SDR family oxidoreductase [Candidatus Seongchinamella marina]